MGQAIVETLGIKQLDQGGNVIGQHPSGGMLAIGGEPFWIRAPLWRYNREKQCWGHADGGYTKHDITPVSYSLEDAPTAMSAEIAQRSLLELREGNIPTHMTDGIEVEGMLADIAGVPVDMHDGVTVRIEDDKHPELHAATCETATEKIDGHYPIQPFEVALQLAAAIKEAHLVAAKREACLLYASVFEGGRPDDVRVTAHPYLGVMEPRVYDHMMQHWPAIPEETMTLFAQVLGTNPAEYFKNRGHLNWPMQALHVHTGLPKIDELTDTRIAVVAGYLRHTPIAKMMSMMLYNTERMFDTPLGVLDVRSIARRILATTHNTRTPHSAHELISAINAQMEAGKIHSPSRYPESGQHGDVRFRMEGGYGTLESIDAGMNPDLRLVLAWTFFNNILNVIALEAIQAAGGDENATIVNLQKRSGMFREQTTVEGAQSAFQWDVAFNQTGWLGKLPQSTMTFATGLNVIRQEIARVGKAYPAMQLQADIVCHMIDQQLAQPTGANLLTYLGGARGTYSPEHLNRGPVTYAKSDLPIDDLVVQEHNGTLIQAKALAQVRDNKDVAAFFGI